MSKALGIVGIGALSAPKCLTGLPLSAWHVALSWLDIITDIIAIVSTNYLSNNVKEICGVNLQGYFFICFLVQCVLLGGNILTHVVLAAVHEMTFSHTGRRDKQHRSTVWRVLVAALRGLFQCKLAYHEFKRSKGGQPGHTAASLHYRMTELVWESPQVVVNWLCLIVSLTYAHMAAIQGVELRSKVFWIPVKLLVLNAGVGLVSLTLAAQEFIRIHPRSAWATSVLPAKLFLGLFDVSKAWWLSLVTGAYAFLSLFNRTALYLHLIHNFAGWGFLAGHGQPPLWRIPILVPSAGFALNVLCLAGLGLLAVFPAAVLSMFIAIPWTSGRTATQRVGRFSSWPGWVLQIMYCAGMIAVFVHAGGLGHSPEAVARDACNKDTVLTIADDYFEVTVVAPICTTILELVLFVCVSLWQFCRRQSYIKQYGNSDPIEMADMLGIAYDWPSSCTYKWKGLFAYRMNTGVLVQQYPSNKAAAEVSHTSAHTGSKAAAEVPHSNSSLSSKAAAEVPGNTGNISSTEAAAAAATATAELHRVVQMTRSLAFAARSGQHPEFV